MVIVGSSSKWITFNFNTSVPVISHQIKANATTKDIFFRTYLTRLILICLSVNISPLFHIQ